MIDRFFFPVLTFCVLVGASLAMYCDLLFNV
jgi:hypothetical protein